MATYVVDTLRRAARSPVPWTLLVVGLAFGWAGLHLGVLALGQVAERMEALLLSTAQMTAALGALWLLGRLFGQDELAELAIAADCAAPGRVGRFLGRGLGTWIVGCLLGACVLFALSQRGHNPSHLLSLYSAIVMETAMVTAWGALLASLAGATFVLPGGLLLWLGGHLPWGTSALLPGRGGTALRALLPGPIPADTVTQRLASTTLVVLGLVTLTVAGTAFAPGRRARGRRSTDTG